MSKANSPDSGDNSDTIEENCDYLSDISFLIVEDNVFCARILETILRNLGARHMERVSNGLEAVKEIALRPPDIIFVDWEMPKMNGIEFTDFIRNSKDSPDPFMPVIMVTALSGKDNVTRARDAGVTEFVVKPCSVTQILGRIKTVIEDPRPFVRKEGFFGPDRRRHIVEFSGEERRGVAIAASTETSRKSQKHVDVVDVLNAAQ